MATYLILDADNTIVNSAEWDGQMPWQPAEGLRAVLAADANWQPGWKWDGTKAYDPNPPPKEEPPESPSLSLGLNKL